MPRPVKEFLEYRDSLFVIGLMLCNDCQQELPLEMFSGSSNNKYGIALTCKSCRNAKYEPHPNPTVERNKILLEQGLKFCKTCGNILPLSRFYGCRKAADRLQFQCKSCESVRKSERSRQVRDWKTNRASKYGVPSLPWYRDDVLAICSNICGLCGEPLETDAWEVDHIIPISRGGPDILENLWVVHRLGNRRKCDRTLDEYFEWLTAGGMSKAEGCGIPDTGESS